MFKLSLKFIFRNKKHTLMIVTGIILPVMLMFSLTQLSNSISLKYKDFLLTNEKQDFKITSISKEVSEKIVKYMDENFKDDIETISINTYIGTCHFNNEASITGILVGAKEGSIKSINDFKIVEGTYPEKSFEIALEKSVNNKLQIPFHVGDKINISVEDGLGNINNIDFIISGFINDTPMQGISNGKRSYIFTNKDTVEILYKNGFKFTNDNYTIDCLVDENKFDEDKIYTIIDKMYPIIDNDYLDIMKKIRNNESTQEEKNQIANVHNRIRINEKKETAYKEKNDDESIGVGIKIISVIIAITMVLLVYSNINLITVERINQYGTLRCIGMSIRQLSRMMIYENIIYGLVGISFGILFGNIFNLVFGEKIMYMIVGEKVRLSLTFKSYLEIIILVTIVMIIVFVSIKNKIKKFEPREALNYCESNNFSKKSIKMEPLERKNNLINLFANRNLKRNKSKTIINFISFVICITLTMVIFNGMLSINIPEKNPKSKFSDYEIIQGFTNENKSYIPDEKIKQISKMDNVKKVYALSDIIENSFTDLDGNQLPSIVIYNNELFDKFIKDNNINEIKLDESIAIFVQNRNTKSEDTYFNDFTTIKEISGYIYNIFSENKKNITLNINKVIKGTMICQGGEIKPDNEYIVINENLAREIYGEITYTDIMIDLDGKVTENFERDISKLLTNEKGITHGKYDSGLEESQRQLVGVLILICYMFIATIIVVFLNIRNTIKSNIINRKIENGMLRAIGMSNRILNKIIRLENTKLTLYAIVISTFISMPINIYISYMTLNKVVIRLWMYIIIALSTIIIVDTISYLQIKRGLNKTILSEVNDE